MLIRDKEKELERALSHRYSPGEANALVRVLFEDLLGVKRAISHTRNGELTPEQEGLLASALSRLLRNEPVQYITGIAFFAGLSFRVNPAVLIPRPETEELALLASEYLQKRPKSRVLDIGTGSGCIAICLKDRNPEADITAIDLSTEALAVAQENARANGTMISFRELNFLDEALRKTLPMFDVIISNPPYIPLAERSRLDKNVADFEPAEALFVEDSDPVVFYRAIAEFALDHLKPDGKIFAEMHEDLSAKPPGFSKKGVLKFN